MHQIVQRLSYLPALIHRQASELPQRSSHLRALVRAQPLHLLIAFQQALPALRTHRIQLRQPVPITLLCIRRQIPEAGLLIQCLLLLLQRQIAVLAHPLCKVRAAQSVALPGRIALSRSPI